MKKFSEGKSLDYTFYAILLGFGLMSIVTAIYLISKTKKPFIVLTQTGIALPKFVAEILWAIITDYEVKDLDGSGTFFRVDLKISDLSKMPNEKGFSTSVDFDKNSQKVILGIQPLRNVKADLVAETILAYWQSAQARESLTS